VNTQGLMAQRPWLGLKQRVGAGGVFAVAPLFDACGAGLLGAGQTVESGLGPLA
jgi:hypothetical protein